MTEDETDRTAWVPEAPMFPGYYAAKNPRPRGKLGEHGVELGTYSIHEALQFETKAECDTWIINNPEPAWVAQEHGFF